MVYDQNLDPKTNAMKTTKTTLKRFDLFYIKLRENST